MQCVKCGAQLPPGADACPDCGEPVFRGHGSASGVARPRPDAKGAPKALLRKARQKAASSKAEAPKAAASKPEPARAKPAPVKAKPATMRAEEPELDEPVEKRAPRVSRRTMLLGLVALVVVAIVSVGGYLVFQQVGSSGGGPDAAAVRLLDSFARYDAQGILDNSTHSSLSPGDLASFAQQRAKDKADAGNLPAVKDVKVVSVQIASSDATTATVHLTASWLTDPAKGTYAERPETLTVVKQDGKWLVKLF